MMMQSPIPNAFWVNAFKGVVTTGVALTMISLYRQKQTEGHEAIAPALKTLRGRELDYDTAASALQDVLDALDQDTRMKRGTVKLALRSRSNASLLVKLLRFDPDAALESARICSLVFLAISKAFAHDVEGRDAWNAVGGHKKLLSIISIAHKEGDADLMDRTAKVLSLVTRVDEDDMQLAIDVPAGAKGAHELGGYASTARMLRILDAGARTEFLKEITSVFASVCTLRTGGLAISKGVDGRSGAAVFLDFVDFNQNQIVVENCIRAIHWMSIHDKSLHKELAEASNVAKLVDVLVPAHTTNTLHSAFGLIASLSHHSAQKQFLTEFMAANGTSQLIKLWCRADEKETRQRAETIARILMRHPMCADHFGHLLETHRSDIMERRSRDEEAMRKEQMQQRQQQMMQQQMMMQMAQSGQLPPGMGGEEE